MKNKLTSILRNNKDTILKATAIPFVATGAITGACAAGCPYGLVNDPYPGQCPRYIDVNGDGVCDLSQTTPTQTSTTSDNDGSTDTSTSDPSIDGSHTNSNLDDGNNLTVSDSDSGIGGSFGDGGSYHFLPVSLMIIGAYFFTHFLFSKGILSRKKHRRIWNILLTFGFLGTGISGVLLIFLINLGIKTALNPDITYLHVELSILMVIVTFIHLHLYKKPFKNMFKVIFNFNSRNKKIYKPVSNSK